MKKFNRKKAKVVTLGSVRQMMREHDLATRELKMRTAVASGTLSAAGAVVGISSDITQGDNISGRTGYVINMHSLKMWFQASMNSAAGVDRFRYIAFYDRLNLGSPPAVTDVLDSASVISDYSYSARTTNRFKILVDKTIPMSINGNSRAVNYEHEFKFKHPVPVALLGTTNNYGKNSVFYLIIDDLGANNSTYAVGYTLRYFDD